MADPWPGIPLPDLLDELTFNRTLLETLDPRSDDYSSSKMDFENKIRYLEHEIEMAGQQPDEQNVAEPAYDSTSTDFYGSQSTRSTEPLSSRFIDSSEASELSTDHNFSFLANAQRSPNVMSSTMSLPVNRKRPRDSFGSYAGYEQQARSRRPTPSPDASIASSPTIASSDDLDEMDDDLRRLLGDTVNEDYKELKRESKRAEKEWQRRQEQERLDAEYARSLQESFNQSQPYAQPRSTSQATLDRSTGSIRSMAPPPVPTFTKPSTSSLQRPSVHFDEASISDRNGWSFSAPGAFPGSNDNNILDVSSDDDDEFAEISSDQFRPNTNRPGSSFTSNGLVDLTSNGSYNPFSFVGAQQSGYGGTSVYSNPAYDLVDRQINSYGPATNGFGGQPSAGIYATPQMPGSFNPVDLTGPSPWNNSSAWAGSDAPNTTEELNALLENIRPDEEIAPENREGDPEGMRYPLMAHQKLGLTWMKAMEEGSNKGGILADDMGLGKTIQALALILARKAEESRRKTTLIVAPVSLMQQWKREIDQKLNYDHKLSVFILHGTDRNATWTDLKIYDIVLTTYGTLGTELKRKLQWDTKVKANPNVRPSGNDDCLPLLGDECKWYRVILDESQHIKNKATKAAIGAWHLQSVYRWCMSGTPMMNNVSELYSLIHFLRIKPYNSADAFQRTFGRPLKGNDPNARERAMKALQVLLKAILLRRTKKSRIDGNPILQLPEKILEQTHATFSEDELAFYAGLENKAQITFNKYLKAGSVGRNYSNVLVLLLRLRQACCHPHLIKDFAIDSGGNTELDLKKNAEAFTEEVVARLKQIEAFDCPICIDVCENPQLFFPCGHAACLDCFSRMTDPSQGLAEGREGGVEIKCPNCRAPIDPRKVTDYATFKEVHFPDEKAAEVDEDGGGPVAAEEEEEADEETSSEDETASDSETEAGSNEESDSGDSMHKFVVPDGVIENEGSDDGDDDDDDDDLNPNPQRAKVESRKELKKDRQETSSRKSKAKGKGKEKAKPKKTKRKGKAMERDKLEKTQLSLAALRKEGIKSKAAKRKYLARLAEDWITSAKIEKTMEILDAVHARNQGEKTIIFSAFTSLLDLLEVPVSQRDWRYKRYDGSMSPADRNAAVLEFTDRASCTVMLVSLKAGNSGLNLTAANNVVIFDPFWNPYIEEQAIDRAYRIGQMKEVHVHRVTVPNTVEDRILALQDKKRELIESALDENAGRSVARLGTRELAYLFGVNREV